MILTGLVALSGACSGAALNQHQNETSDIKVSELWLEQGDNWSGTLALESECKENYGCTVQISPRLINILPRSYGEAEAEAAKSNIERQLTEGLLFTLYVDTKFQNAPSTYNNDHHVHITKEASDRPIIVATLRYKEIMDLHLTYDVKTQSQNSLEGADLRAVIIDPGVVELDYAVPEFSCTDGIDNNGDGRADCEDPGCYYNSDPRNCLGSWDEYHWEE